MHRGSQGGRNTRMAQRVAYGAMAIAVLVLLFMQDVVIAKQAIE